MHGSPIKKRDLILAILFSSIILVCIFLSSYLDKTTKIVFCDVGQGDGAYIRIKNQIDVVIDAGPNSKILNCLGKYMPFWDKKIELAFLSHHDKDHYGGFFNIADRYEIAEFLTINYGLDNQTYKKLQNKLGTKKVLYQNLVAEDKIMILDDSFVLYWPPVDLKSYQGNDYSLVFLFQENNFRALFTGDASPAVLNEIASSSTSSPPRNDINNIEILKIPHHGSKNGLTKNFLELADPKVAVISVGKNNSYGHPSHEVLDLLKAKKIKIKRTDEDGDVVFNLKELP